MRQIHFIAIVIFTLSLWACDSSGGSDLSSAALLLNGSPSGSSCSGASTTDTPTTLTSTATCSSAIYNLSDVPSLKTGAESGAPTCVTDIAAEAPCWMKQNFHCVKVVVSGSNYVITTTDMPPYKSYYYKDNASYQDTMDTVGGFYSNPNKILAQNITMTIPVTPKLYTGCNDSTAGIDSVGISTLGAVIFNNQAAPGDSFSTEYFTMDRAQGHPQNTGKYHYHTEPFKITNDSDELIGLMLDGFPIYGKKIQGSSSYPTLDSTAHTRSCTTTHFPDGTYCYHVENDTSYNAYIIGSYFKGKRGSTN
ncbi:YHYH protein [Leptospira wolffii]|uniref:YHYH protein n=1 Tax=Leptospira wolffii TaxID=409998 RepID=UPI001083FFA4|nr:YHYH protein [Leptospira wolffii]TGK62749.1 YHYH protein [Leptospira wolffii]TGK73864.1 YHYH protein [Leptospira wolffii]TGK75019.1 YHYH protein [Leptospira wolffii]TGL28726.1 YHYH protein [Leptospira wolffii]